MLPAGRAAFALTLFFGVGGMLFALLSPFAMFFPFICSPWLSPFSFGVLLGALGGFLILYGYGVWANLRFYLTVLSWKWLVAAFAASLVAAGILWATGVFYYPGALIPTVSRRELWLNGNFIWMAVAVILLFNGCFLPFAACIRKRAHCFFTEFTVCCWGLAMIFGVLYLGMFANFSKYYSLSASCDWESPHWTFPFAIECAAGITFLFFAAAYVGRIVLYARFSGLPFRPEIARAVKRGVWGWLIFLLVFGGGSFCGSLLFRYRLHRLPEYRQLEAFRKNDSGSSIVNWAHFQPLNSPIFTLSFNSRLAVFKDEAALRNAETLLKQYPDLVSAVDALCAATKTIPFDLNSSDTHEKSTLLVRIARLQRLRVLIALKRGETAEAIHLWKLMGNLVMIQSEFVALAEPGYSAFLMEEFFNAMEDMISYRSLSRNELLQFRRQLPELIRISEHCPEVSETGVQIARATEQEQWMNFREFGFHFEAWRWCVPGLGFVLDGNYYYALKTPASYFFHMEIQGNAIQRGKELEKAVEFLLGGQDSASPSELTGELQRNYLFFLNDGASSLNIENEKFRVKCTYRQFGSDGGDIILLENK